MTRFPIICLIFQQKYRKTNFPDWLMGWIRIPQGGFFAFIPEMSLKRFNKYVWQSAEDS